MKTVIKHSLIFQEVFEIDFEDRSEEKEEERNDYHPVPFPGIESLSNQKNSSISLQKSKSLQNLEGENFCQKLHLAYVLKIENEICYVSITEKLYLKIT